MSSKAVTVSAPGKVLFTGGFLVLDRKHTGLVLGLNARIHAHVQSWNGDDSIQTNGSHESLILVRSPQFRDARWLYTVGTSKPAQGEAIAITQIISERAYTQSRNKFVETTLQYTLTYLQHRTEASKQPVKITILADNDYYSQSASTSLTPKHNFTDFGVTIANAHKTGLGSSAALVTSLTGALLAFYSPTSTSHSDPSLPPSATVHNLAQASHCAAQGKVGSGFDIAAAVYGSCIYRRFTPSILEGVGEAHSAGFGERLHRCVDDLELERRWDFEVASEAVQIPKDLLLVMCDVDCGSETPGMVRQVLQWRKEKPAEADLLWDAIERGSMELVQELGRLSVLEGTNASDHTELADIISTVRSLVREMSRKSGVPIEPDVITELLDYCSDRPGVIGGVAPGAGGYDAVALLIKNDDEVLRDLQDRLETWSSKEESTGATIGKVRLLGVKQANEGMRLENPQAYGDWTH